MTTRITKLFKIQHPIVLPGMSWISKPKLVAAVSNAGGLGILATGPLSATETAAAIKEIRSLTDKPFGIGTTLMMPVRGVGGWLRGWACLAPTASHSTHPLFFQGAKENATVALAEEVPVINYSLGKGDWLAQKAHAYGGKVMATVTTVKHGRYGVWTSRLFEFPPPRLISPPPPIAKSAQASGADALLVTGHEAAAHGGDVTSLVLVPAIASKVPELPLVAAGGFGDGRGLLAALSLGADAVAMGTRFACTEESPLHANVKAVIASAAQTESDTIYSKNVDGIWARVMKTPYASEAARTRPNPITVLVEAMKQARRFGINPIKVLPGLFVEPEKIFMLAQFGGATRKFELATVRTYARQILFFFSSLGSTPLSFPHHSHL